MITNASAAVNVIYVGME